MLLSSLVALTLAPVTFSIDIQGAKEVAFAGDLTGWASGRKMSADGTRWSIAYDLPSDARIEYKYIVDGRWKLDDNAPKAPNGLGGENNVWKGPDYRETAPIGPPKMPMERIEANFSDGKTQWRKFTVFVPKSGGKNLPMLIYFDGQDYEKYVTPQNILQNLVEQGRVRPAVLVLIPPVDREQEYWKNSGPFEEFMIRLVRRAPASMIPASRRAGDVFVGGASLGGLIALRLATKHPKVFAGGVHAQSGAFWADTSLLERASLDKIAPNARLSCDWGAYESSITTTNRELAATLKQTKRPWLGKETNEGHNWTAWRERFAEGIVHLLGPPRR
ncbi:MAG TPA: alpha/beta hydrolase-fold protein [Fimbriimonadaceae bacterium]|nr:alpha/beta hydrolase-fold protein [Fimbriimonadaceae bacterium]